MIHVQVHHGADPWFSRPCEKAFTIFLDETDRSVNKLGIVLPKVRPYCAKERHESSARHVELGDHFRALDPGLEPTVEFLVVIVKIKAHLVQIGPVSLSRG